MGCFLAVKNGPSQRTKISPHWAVGLPIDTYSSTLLHPWVVVARVFGDTLWF